MWQKKVTQSTILDWSFKSLLYICRAKLNSELIMCTSSQCKWKFLKSQPEPRKQYLHWVHYYNLLYFNTDHRGRVQNSLALRHYLRQVQPHLCQVTEKMLTVGAKNYPNLKNNSIVEFLKSLQMPLDSMFLICFWSWPTKWNRNESENVNCEDKHLNRELQNSGILRTLRCC